MEQQDIYITFDKYLNKELSAAEVALFEQELANDEALSDEFMLYQQIHETLSAKHQAAQQYEVVEKSVEKVGNDYFSNLTNEKTETPVIPLSRPSPFRRLLYAAAMMVGLLFGTYFIYQMIQPSYTTTELYAAYDSFPQESFTSKSDQEQSLPLAEAAYNQGDYANAIKHINQYLATNTSPVQDYRLYRCRGISYLAENEYALALQDFDRLKEQASFKNEGHWYAALCYLKMNELEKVEQELEGIDEGSSVYGKAVELRGKLGRVVE